MEAILHPLSQAVLGSSVFAGTTFTNKGSDLEKVSLQEGTLWRLQKWLYFPFPVCVCTNGSNAAFSPIGLTLTPPFLADRRTVCCPLYCNKEDLGIVIILSISL